MTYLCRCGMALERGDTIGFINHVTSDEHRDGLARLGIYDHDHSYHWVDDRGRPVDETHPMAVPYRRPGCPACDAVRSTS